MDRDQVIATAQPFETTDVAILAAELGLGDDPVAVDVLARCWRAGFWRAVLAADQPARPRR